MRVLQGEPTTTGLSHMADENGAGDRRVLELGGALGAIGPDTDLDPFCGSDTAQSIRSATHPLRLVAHRVRRTFLARD
jgi:hypothetical protein